MSCVAVAFSERNFRSPNTRPPLERTVKAASPPSGLLQTTSRPVVIDRELTGRAIGQVQLYQTLVCYRTLLQLLPALHPCGSYCCTLTTASSHLCVAGDEIASAPNCTIHEVRISPCAEASQGKPCVIKRGRSASIEFDFSTSKCPVAIRVDTPAVIRSDV